MKIDVKKITALTQGDLLKAVQPCEVTQNFFELLMQMQHMLNYLVDNLDGEVPVDEKKQIGMLRNLAIQFVNALPIETLARELEGLKAFRLTDGLELEVTSRLVIHKPFTVGHNLRVTLEEAYVALMRKVLSWMEEPV